MITILTSEVMAFMAETEEWNEGLAPHSIRSEIGQHTLAEREPELGVTDVIFVVDKALGGPIGPLRALYSHR